MTGSCVQPAVIAAGSLQRLYSWLTAALGNLYSPPRRRSAGTAASCALFLLGELINVSLDSKSLSEFWNAGRFGALLPKAPPPRLPVICSQTNLLFSKSLHSLKHVLFKKIYITVFISNNRNGNFQMRLSTHSLHVLFRPPMYSVYFYLSCLLKPVQCTAVV